MNCFLKNLPIWYVNGMLYVPIFFYQTYNMETGLPYRQQFGVNFAKISNILKTCPVQSECRCMFYVKRYDSSSKRMKII